MSNDTNPDKKVALLNLEAFIPKAADLYWSEWVFVWLMCTVAKRAQRTAN